MLLKISVQQNLGNVNYMRMYFETLIHVEKLLSKSKKIYNYLEKHAAFNPFKKSVMQFLLK